MIHPEQVVAKDFGVFFEFRVHGLGILVWQNDTRHFRVTRASCCSAAVIVLCEKFQVLSTIWILRKWSKYIFSFSMSLDLLFLGRCGLGELETTVDM